MKHLTPFILLLLFPIGQTLGQGCFPDANFAQEDFGLYPEGTYNMDCGGLSSSKTLITFTDTVLNFEIVPGSPTNVNTYIDAFRLDSIQGLPTGITVSTDVMNSATEQSPYGTWLNNGTVPNQDATIGCISFSGSNLAWLNASTNGPNNDGVFTLVLNMDMRIAGTNPDLSSIIQNGSWMSTVPASLGGGVIQMEFELNVNESGCTGGDLFVFPEVTSDNSGTPACDGSATVEVYNGTAPYQYLFSNQVTTQTADDLCGGIYSVQVTDAVGAQSVVQFAVASSENVYSNIGGSVQSEVDTLFTYYNGCDLDYTLPLDSFYITNAITAGPDTCIVTWVAWQQGEPYTLTTYYPFLGPEPTVFSLILWCQNGRSESGVFQLYEYLDLSVGTEEELARVDFSVRPNPSNGLFSIQMANNGPVAVELFDSKGSLIRSERYSGNSIFDLDLESAQKGVYILKIQTETGVGFERLIKQ